MTSYTRIECTNCNKSLKVSQDLAGQTRKCPYCRAAVKIPEVIETEQEGTYANIVVSSESPTPQRSAPRSRRNRRRRSWFQSGTSDSASSDVSLVVSGAIGLGLTVVWLLAMLPLRDYQFGQLFWDRGLVPFATTFLMFWSVAILIMKWLNLKQQRESMLLDVLPSEIANEITLDSLDRFVKHINDLPMGGADSFLINRVLRGIEHFRVRKSAAETVTMMESQSAIDANNVAGSFTLVKVFIWALPILGFIGTVLGVSTAVAQLASSLDTAADMGAMKAALNGVFGGLGTAFDTTLLALIMSMLVKIPTSALQKSEEDLITAVDEYCNENLLRRLNDGREGGAERTGGMVGHDATVFREAVEAAMGTHHAELENWLERLDAIGSKLTTQVSDGWDKINARMQKQQQQYVGQMQKQQVERQKQIDDQIEKAAVSAEGIQTALASVATQASQMQGGLSQSMETTQSSLEEHFSGLEQGLASLSSVLEKLGEQSVIVQQVETPASRGWFGRRKAR